MLFVIKRTNGAYYHNKGRIILFETEKEAENFINTFISYSIDRLMAENKPLESAQATIAIISQSQIIPVDFDIEHVECGTVYVRELYGSGGENNG